MLLRCDSLIINYRIMKRIALIISLVCCMLSASAQDRKEWSIIPNAKTGVALEGLQAVFRTGAGVDAKLAFNEHWSLLAGVEYEYRFSSDSMNYKIGLFHTFDKRIGLRHFFRVPVRAEYTHQGYYMNAGLFVERATNPWLTKMKRLDIGYGVGMEIGRRIQLSENSHLRIGLQTQTSFYSYTRHDLNYVEHRAGWGFTSLLLSVGYEHRL